MHVAQFIHRYPPALGGAEAYVARLCDSLTARGDQVRVWTTTAVELAEMWGKPSARIGHEDATPRIHRYSPLHFPLRRYVLKALSLLPIRRWQCLATPCNPICPEMWRDAGRATEPLDAVHAAAFPYSFPIVCALRLARRHNVPFFLTPFLHLGDPTDPHDRTRQRYTAPHLRWLLRQADGVFVQTRLERDAVIGLGIPENRVILQGLGVEPGECTGGDKSRALGAWGVAPGEVVVGHLANNSEEKGSCDLLRAAERAWARGHNFRIVLAGPEMPNFQSFWAGFGMKEKVMRLGILTDEEKRDFYSAIDVFALPSRTDSFGLVLLEAWANRKPNLVYRAGGPAELVRAGIDGLHARCGNVEELSQQLGKLVVDLGLRERLGRSGFARISREFRWSDKLERVRSTMATRAGKLEPPATLIARAG